ncbi:hypothetical protein KC960_04085 [Candidatus Saccharibacteria bacterium]|nr:hypothetical protein [Candidatus Saccharibacteria bacterium]
MIDAISGQSELAEVHRQVLQQVGIDRDSVFSTYFGGHITVAGVSESQKMQFVDYYEELAKKKGYLEDLFDFYRKFYNYELKPGIGGWKTKPPLIWTLASFAAACEVLSGNDLSSLQQQPSYEDVHTMSTVGTSKHTLWTTRSYLSNLTMRRILNYPNAFKLSYKFNPPIEGE